MNCAPSTDRTAQRETAGNGQCGKSISQVTRIFSPDRATDIIVWRGQTPIRRHALLSDAFSLIGSIPSSAAIVNCCRDRYNFLVVFLGCLLRGKPAILPNDARRASLMGIADQFPGALFFADHETDVSRSVVRCAEFSGASASISHEIPAIPKEQVATILFTSGSTGRPVPNARTWQWLVEGANDYARGLGLDGLDGCNVVSTVPSQHSYGLETSAMLPLRAAAAVSAVRPFFPKDVIDALSSLPPPTALVTTPYHLDVLLRSDHEMPAVSLIVSATSPLSKELANAAEASFGGMVLEVYGCTEVGLVGTRRPKVSAAWQPARSLKLGFSNGHAFVTGRHFPGRIVLADTITRGRNGTFYLGHRSNDVVKVGGRRTSLAGLNSLLKAIPGVIDSVIICRPRGAPAHSMRLVGFVVLSGRSIGDVKRELRSAISGPFMPRPLLQVPELPRGPTGKIHFESLLSLVDGASAQT